MEISTPSNQRDDSCDPQFGALLNRPFHSVELEDSKQQRQLEAGGLGWDFFPEFKFHATVCDSRDSAAMDIAIRNDVKFLPDASAEDTNQMVGMSAGECGPVTGNFIGDPSAAGHASPESLVASPEYEVASRFHFI